MHINQNQTNQPSNFQPWAWDKESQNVDSHVAAAAANKVSADKALDAIDPFGAFAAEFDTVSLHLGEGPAVFIGTAFGLVSMAWELTSGITVYATDKAHELAHLVAAHRGAQDV